MKRTHGTTPQRHAATLIVVPFDDSKVHYTLILQYVNACPMGYS
jgi:hypothetical protein